MFRFTTYVNSNSIDDVMWISQEKKKWSWNNNWAVLPEKNPMTFNSIWTTILLKVRLKDDIISNQARYREFVEDLSKLPGAVIGVSLKSLESKLQNFASMVLGKEGYVECMRIPASWWKVPKIAIWYEQRWALLHEMFNENPASTPELWASTVCRTIHNLLQSMNWLKLMR